MVHLSVVFHDFPKEGPELKQPIEGWFNTIVYDTSLNKQSPVANESYGAFSGWPQ
jgi:hypothetical protein